MAKERSGKGKSSFGKRQPADDAFRKKKKEGGSSYGKKDSGTTKGGKFRSTRSSDGDSRGGYSRPRRSDSRDGDSRPRFSRGAGSGRSESAPRGRFSTRPRRDSESGGEGRERPFPRRSSGAGASRGYGKPRGDGDRGERGGRSFSKGSGEGFRSRGGSSYEGGKRTFSAGSDRRGTGRPRKPFDGDQDHNKDDDSDRRRPRFDRERKSESAPRERRSFVESKIEKERERVERSVPTEPKEGKDELIRLNKFIANSGVCSRREADDLIKMGLVSVNGVTITEMGHKVKATDDVRYEGKKLTAERPVYILLNKPKGFITTTDDPQERNTVMQLIAGACKERVYPVGRLDRNTTGLLLLTNDGDLTDKLTHPSFNAKKIYKVELDKPLTKADFEKIKEGIVLEEGRAMVDDLAIVSDDGKTVGIELHIGWNHVVRRIFDALEYSVVKLDRVVYAGLDKKDLKRGQWRFLKTDEIVRLKHFGQ